ncbi:TPA: hypothetical protein ACLAZ2_002112, partial [Neisseria meningitidis]
LNRKPRIPARFREKAGVTFPDAKNAEIHVFRRFQRFFTLFVPCAKTNSPPQYVQTKPKMRNTV